MASHRHAAFCVQLILVQAPLRFKSTLLLVALLLSDAREMNPPLQVSRLLIAGRLQLLHFHLVRGGRNVPIDAHALLSGPVRAATHPAVRRDGRAARP